MSSGQKKFRDDQQAQAQLAAQQQQADRTRMLTDSPQLTFLRNIAKQGADWIAGKNYASPPPGMFQYDLNDPAKRAKMREADMNLQSTGAYALGANGANPTALALARTRLNDQMDQDNAANYEGAVNNYMNSVKGMNSDLVNYDYTRDNALLGNAMNRWQAASKNWGDTTNQMASIVPGMIGSALGAAGTVAGGYFSHH